MIGDSGREGVADGGSLFGKWEAIVIGAVCLGVVARSAPAERPRMAFLLLAVGLSYLALTHGLATLQSKLEGCKVADGAAARFGMVAAVLLGGAFACVLALADLSDRLRMAILLLAICVSDFALAWGIATLRPRLAGISYLLNNLLMIVFLFFRIDRFCLEMDRLDFAFSALVVAAVAVVLGWSLVEVSRIRSLDPSKPAPDAELSGGVTRGAHQH